MAFLKQKIEIGVEEAELKAAKTFSSFPAVVKWAIVLLSIACIPAYFIAKTASEKIWLARYQAGSVKAKPSFSNPLAPQISGLQLGRPSAGTYSAWAKISNPNLDLSLDNAGFKFNFYNSQKQLIFSYPDDKSPEKFFLLPNQSKYLTVPRFSTAEPIAYPNLTFDQNLPWQKRLAIPKVDLIAPKPQIRRQDSPKALIVEGYFVNNSPYGLKRVTLTFKLLDAQNKIIDVTRGAAFTVAPFERRAYNQPWPELSAAGADHAEVTADTDTLDPGNLSAGEDR